MHVELLADEACILPGTVLEEDGLALAELSFGSVAGGGEQVSTGGSAESVVYRSQTILKLSR